MPVSHRPEPSQDRRVSVTVVTIADLVKLARRTRTFITDPAKLWTVRYDPERDVLQGVRFHAPDAIDYFGAPAVLAAALTTGTVCHWCQAFARAATAGKRLPTNEAMLELLGRPCDGCAPVIFRHIIDGLETAMAAPFDAPYPGSVDAGRPPGRQGPGVRPPIHHRPPLHDLRTQLLPAAALAGGGHPMSPDLSGRTFGRMTVIGSASEDVVLPRVAGGWWLGRCVCGREMIAPAEAFLARRLESCGRPPRGAAGGRPRLGAYHHHDGRAYHVS